MGKGKRDNDIVISFLGGSRDDVCGSATLISYVTEQGRECILCDLGIIQGSMSPEIEYSVNKKMVENIPIADIKAVFISHAHCDHSAAIPILGDDKFTGKIIMDYKTSVIAKDLIKDSVYLHDCLIKYLKSKGKKSKHLFTTVNMHKAFNKMEIVEKHIKYKLNDYVSYEFFESGHCLGSQIKFYITLPNKSVKTIVYTGDLSSKHNSKCKPYDQPMDIIPKANCYIFEGTYGANDGREFNKKTVENEVRELKKTLTNALQDGKKVFFPCFSFARTQELLTLIYSFFKDEEWFKKMSIPVYVDGKLTNKICERYSEILEDDKLSQWQEVRNWSHVRYNKEYKGTESLIAARQLGIYISSSGFVQPKTRSCEYVKSFMGSEKSLICFIGYYGTEDSIAGQLVNSPVGKPIKIDGSTIIKSCEIIQFKSFSSHIQKDEIVNYWKQITAADKIIIHHASSEAKENLIKLGKEELMKIGKTTKISATDRYHSQFVL